MTLINEVYDYIVNKYSTNEPIFLTIDCFFHTQKGVNDLCVRF